MIEELKKGRFLGLPIHVILVHFPAGLLPAAFLFDLAGLGTGEGSLHAASLWCLTAGTAMGLAAGAFGFWDFVGLRDARRLEKATWHGSLEFVMLLLFGLLAGLRWQDAAVWQAPGAWELAAMGAGVALMGVANHLGGELVHTD